MNLKRSLVFVSLLGVSLPVVAGDINNIKALSQPNFRLLSEDLGAALSYKPLTPTAPLGITGFDLGIAATSVTRSSRAARRRRRSASAEATPSSPAWISSN